MSLESDAAVLSVAPWFDQETGRDLLELSETAYQPTEERFAEAVSGLALAGVIVRSGSHGWRISEPIRTNLRTQLQESNSELYRKALTVFAEHAKNGLGELLTEVMGARGANLNVRTLDALAVEDDRHSLDRLVEQTYDLGAGASELSTISRLVRSYAPRANRKRELFLEGMALWRTSRRSEAARLFEQVLAVSEGDRAEAVSAHLCGVVKHDQRQFDTAIEMMRRAVAILRGLDDVFGLVVTLTSLGRTLRDRSLSTGDSEDLSTAAAYLTEALTVGRRLEDQSSVGIAAIVLAQTYRSLGLIEPALEHAQYGVSVIPDSGRDAIWSRTILAGVYRDYQDAASAMRVAEEAYTIAIEEQIGDKDLAQLLNVLAASERRVGRTDDAIRHADESLRLGYLLQDPRHMAHALNTLALASIDALERSHVGVHVEVEAIQTMLTSARELLRQLDDANGVSIVEHSLAKLSRWI